MSRVPLNSLSTATGSDPAIHACVLRDAGKESQQDRSSGIAWQGLQHHRQLQFLPMACQLAWPSPTSWLWPGQTSPKSPHCHLMAPAGTSSEGQAPLLLHIRAPTRGFLAQLTSVNTSCRCSHRKAMSVCRWTRAHISSVA